MHSPATNVAYKLRSFPPASCTTSNYLLLQFSSTTATSILTTTAKNTSTLKDVVPSHLLEWEAAPPLE